MRQVLSRLQTPASHGLPRAARVPQTSAVELSSVRQTAAVAHSTAAGYFSAVRQTDAVELFALLVQSDGAERAQVSYQVLTRESNDVESVNT